MGSYRCINRDLDAHRDSRCAYRDLVTHRDVSIRIEVSMWLSRSGYASRLVWVRMDAQFASLDLDTHRDVSIRIEVSMRIESLSGSEQV
jgi:hypothetical protein